jgi:hypothetical protein
MLHPEKILETVKSIRNSYINSLETNENIADIKKDLREKNVDFSNNYPALFDMIFHPVDNWESDLKGLTNMVQLATRVKNKEISQHDASVKIGGTLVDQYVKPKLNKD